MAVVDFGSRYKSKPRFDKVRNSTQNADITSVKINWFSIQCGLRRTAHIALAVGLFLAANQVFKSAERLQYYLAPYVG